MYFLFLNKIINVLYIVSVYWIKIFNIIASQPPFVFIWFPRKIGQFRIRLYLSSHVFDTNY